MRALERLGLADLFGECRVPMLCLNVTYPLVPEEIRDFCADKKAVLIVEEGFPEYIEQMVATELRRGDIQTRLYGKDVLPQAGEYTQDVLLQGLAQFLTEARPARLDLAPVSDKLATSWWRICPRSSIRCATCRRGRRPSAPAARSVRCSRRSS